MDGLGFRVCDDKKMIQLRLPMKLSLPFLHYINSMAPVVAFLMLHTRLPLVH